MGEPSVHSISELRSARSEMPEEYDTGDGIIKYAACLDAVAASLEGTVDTTSQALRACQS